MEINELRKHEEKELQNENELQRNCKTSPIYQLTKLCSISSFLHMQGKNRKAEHKKKKKKKSNDDIIL